MLHQGPAAVQGAAAQPRQVRVRESAGAGIGEQEVALHPRGIGPGELRGPRAVRPLEQPVEDPVRLRTDPERDGRRPARQAVLKGSGQIVPVACQMVPKPAQGAGCGVTAQVGDQAEPQGPGQPGADDLCDRHDDACPLVSPWCPGTPRDLR